MGPFRLAVAAGVAALVACGLPIAGTGPSYDATPPDSGASFDAGPDATHVVPPDTSTGPGDSGSIGPSGDDGPAPGSDADAIADGPAGDAGCTANLSNDPSNCGSCGHSCAGGSCQAGSCQPVAIVTSASPIRAMGLSSSYLVWATTSRQIFRAALDGSGAQHIFTPAADVSELVVAGTDIYYTTGDVHRVALDGTGDTIVVAGGADACLQISGTTAYVVSGSTVPPAINAVNLTAGTRAPLVPTGDLLLPWGVAVTTSDVYWSGNQHGNPDGGIWRMALGGGAASEIVPHLANPNCLTIYSGGLFWPNSDDGTIMTSALDGTGAHVLATGQDLTYPPTTVAVDMRFVYWSSGSTIQRLAR
jgi:hypothetical protein